MPGAICSFQDLSVTDTARARVSAAVASADDGEGSYSSDPPLRTSWLWLLATHWLTAN